MNRQLLLSPVLRSDHRYHDSAVSLCCSLPKQIHTSLAKIFTTDLNTFVQSVARINRNWKFLVVTLHVWVSRMWRQQLIFQTADTSGVDISTQRVISRSDVIVCRPSRQHKQGRWGDNEAISCILPSMMFPNQDQIISTALWRERNREFNLNKRKETFSVNITVVLQKRTEGTFPVRAASLNSDQFTY